MGICSAWQSRKGALRSSADKSLVREGRGPPSLKTGSSPEGPSSRAGAPGPLDPPLRRRRWSRNRTAALQGTALLPTAAIPPGPAGWQLVGRRKPTSGSAQIHWLEAQPRTAPELMSGRTARRPRREQVPGLLKGKVRTQLSRILPALSGSCFLTVSGPGRAKPQEPPHGSCAGHHMVGLFHTEVCCRFLTG